MPPDLHMGLRIEVGDGIELRPVRLEDAEPIYFLVEVNRERLGQWLPWVPAVQSAADEAAFIRGTHEQLESGTGLSCVMLVDRAIAGTMSCSINVANRSAEVGYWVAESFGGQGVVTRGVRAMTTFLFADLDMHRVAIRAATDNARSRAVPERLGFVHEGTQRHAEILNDEFFDLEVYSMLAPEWPTNGAH